MLIGGVYLVVDGLDAFIIGNLAPAGAHPESLLRISIIASLLPARRTVVVVIASLIMNLRTGDHHQDRKSFGTPNHSLSSFQ